MKSVQNGSKWKSKSKKTYQDVLYVIFIVRIMIVKVFEKLSKVDQSCPKLSKVDHDWPKLTKVDQCWQKMLKMKAFLRNEICPKLNKMDFILIKKCYFKNMSYLSWELHMMVKVFEKLSKVAQSCQKLIIIDQNWPKLTKEVESESSTNTDIVSLPWKFPDWYCHTVGDYSISVFLKKCMIKVTPWRFLHIFFRAGLTLAFMKK